MEFKNITTFLKVAELRNFSKAAKKLGYSQSAVTIQIQQLEHELGVQLFERIGRGAALTEEGQSFVFYANEILGAAEKARDSIRKGGWSLDGQPAEERKTQCAFHKQLSFCAYRAGGKLPI